MTQPNRKITQISTSEREYWTVDLYIGDRVIATISDLDSRAQAELAADFVQVGFNSNFELSSALSQGMVEAGLGALEQAKLDGGDRCGGVVPDDEIVRQVYQAMHQVAIADQLSGGSFLAT